MRIAIYDLDRTVLRLASYTPFLFFAARRRARWRLAFAPVWIAAMALYKARLFSRDALKNFGLRLFLGRNADEAALADLGAAFARHVVPAWVAPRAAASIAREREEGHRLVLATAAMEFYARPIGELLGFDAVVATECVTDPGRHAPRIAGRNCYAADKLEACRRWLDDAGVVRAEAPAVLFRQRERRPAARLRGRGVPGRSRPLRACAGRARRVAGGALQPLTASSPAIASAPRREALRRGSTSIV